MTPRPVASGAAALAALERAVSEERVPALVLLDAQMPEMDGFAVAEQIRATPALDGVPIVMLTSSGSRGDGGRCRELSIEGYLVKPVEVAKLAETVCTVLGGGTRWARKGTFVTTHSLRESRQRLRVLFAGDNPVNRIVALKKLQKRGHFVKVVEDGLQAVAAYKKAEFDVVLMDVQMPVMDGFQSTALIREQQTASGRRVAIITLTDHAMKGDRERCLEAGMDDHITKPFKTDELIRVVRRTLAASPSSPSLAASRSPRY